MESVRESDEGGRRTIRKLKTSNEEIETEIAQLLKQRQDIALQIKKLRNRLNARNFKSKQIIKHDLSKDQETVEDLLHVNDLRHVEGSKDQNDKSSDEEDQNDL
jgi:ribosomal 30S subunit maturation factor RimM